MQIAHNVCDWIRKGKDFWYFIIPLFVTFLLFFILRPQQQWGLSIFKIFGIVNELLGLWIVFRSLSDEIKNYGLNGYLYHFVQWIKSFESIYTKKAGIAVAISGVSATASAGEVSVLIENRPTTTEEKIEFIFSELKRIEADTKQVGDKLRLHFQTLEKRVQEIDQKTEMSLYKFGHRLEEKATGEFCFLVSGLLLTALGVVLTNTPDKIFALVGFCTN